jgi:putative effector of murein hydrolase
MSNLATIFLGVTIAFITSYIISDCLEWKEDVDLRLLLVKIVTQSLAVTLVSYPFAKSLVKDGFSYVELIITFVLVVGYIGPLIAKLMTLFYKILLSHEARDKT